MVCTPEEESWILKDSKKSKKMREQFLKRHNIPVRCCGERKGTIATGGRRRGGGNNINVVGTKLIVEIWLPNQVHLICRVLAGPWNIYRVRKHRLHQTDLPKLKITETSFSSLTRQGDCSGM